MGDRMSEIRTSGSESSSGGGQYYLFAIIFALIAIGIAIYGINTMYNNSYDARVVGGDAYNYIIYATRGTAFVASGIISALFSVCFCIVGSNAAARD